MDSAHHQLTVHIHIGHLRSPVEQRQLHQNCQSPRRAQRNQTFTAHPRCLKHFEQSQFERTIRIVFSQNTQELHTSYSSHFTPSTPPIVLLRSWQNTKRIIFSYSYQCAIKKPLPASAPLHSPCIVPYASEA